MFLYLLSSFSFFVMAQSSISDIAKDYEENISSFSKKAAFLYFESTEGIMRDGIIFSEKLIESIVKGGKITVVDPMITGAKFKKFGVKNVGELDYENTIRLSKELQTNIIVIGSVSRIDNIVEIRGRIVKIPELDIIAFLTHRIVPEWDDSFKKMSASKKNSLEDFSDFKPTEKCKYSELVKIATQKNIAYPFSCVEFPCKMIDCSKYPTAKNKIFKIYFQDPSKTVIVTDEFFNIIDEYQTQ